MTSEQSARETAREIVRQLVGHESAFRTDIVTAAILAAEQRGADESRSRCEALTTALRHARDVIHDMILSEEEPGKDRAYVDRMYPNIMGPINAALAASGAETTGRERAVRASTCA